MVAESDEGKPRLGVPPMEGRLNSRSLNLGPSGEVSFYRGGGLRIRFDTPQAIGLAQAPFDLFLARVGDRGHQIHRPQYAGTDTMNTSLFGTGDDASTPARHFVNHQGIPFVLNVPAVTLWPKESVRIEQAYPDIVGFGASGGQQHQDWYQSNAVLPLLWSGGANGTPRPVPRIFGALPGRCDDGNVCTDDSCGPLGQCVSQPVDGRDCDDHDTCTTSSSCAGPVCTPGPLRDADGDGHVAASCLPGGRAGHGGIPIA